jgi:hypothetical protein
VGKTAHSPLKAPGTQKKLFLRKKIGPLFEPLGTAARRSLI